MYFTTRLLFAVPGSFCSAERDDIVLLILLSNLNGVYCQENAPEFCVDEGSTIADSVQNLALQFRNWALTKFTGALAPAAAGAHRPGAPCKPLERVDSGLRGRAAGGSFFKAGAAVVVGEDRFNIRSNA